MRLFSITAFCLFLILAVNNANGQTITGAWKGRIGSLKTELKLVKKGDSLVGTSYYYFGRNSYRRYSIKGYFDPETNSVIWWDDVLLEEKGALGNAASHKEPFLSVADFNCPGENTMLLEGKSSDKNDMERPTGPVNMEKTTTSAFSDEWDYVLDNYFVGANDPQLIDSIAHIAFMEPVIPEGFEGTLTPPVVKAPGRQKAEPPVVRSEPAAKPEIAKAEPTEKTISGKDAPPTTSTGAKSDIKADVKTIQQKFATRNNKLQTVIPITSDKIELRFYDNAQVDGDSIALFLNGKLIFKNIRLTEQAYTIHLNASDLNDDNELVMVAENLGSIPPNTSFMVAIVGDKRYEARLYASENSSALVRFVKQFSKE